MSVLIGKNTSILDQLTPSLEPSYSAFYADGVASLNFANMFYSSPFGFTDSAYTIGNNLTANSTLGELLISTGSDTATISTNTSVLASITPNIVSNTDNLNSLNFTGSSLLVNVTNSVDVENTVLSPLYVIGP